MIVSKLTLSTSSTARIAMRTGLILACTALISMSIILKSNAQEDKGKSKKKTSANSKSPAESNTPVEAKTVLVFQTDAKGGVSAAVGDDIQDVIKSRLSATKLYSPVSFSGSIPTVKLAMTQQTLTASDIKHPFDIDSKLKKLSGITGYTLVLVSSIDDYQLDPATGVISVVMSARLVDYSGAKAVVRSAAQSADSPANKANKPELEVATALVRSLTDKLMTSVLTPKPTTK